MAFAADGGGLPDEPIGPMHRVILLLAGSLIPHAFTGHLAASRQSEGLLLRDVVGF